IEGRVTSAATGAGISGATVLAYDASGNFVSATGAASDGSYSLAGLASGTYRIEFEGPSGSGSYQFQFYDNRTSLATADPVTVTAGQPTTGINAALQGGGAISGTVTDAVTHLPVAGIEVSAHASGDTIALGASTDANGRYTISGLHVGSYTVSAYSPSA